MVLGRKTQVFVCSWESTLQNTTGLNVNFTVLYVKLVDLSYFQTALVKVSKNILSFIESS